MLDMLLVADLATWHYEGLVFNGTAQMTGMPVDPPYRIERPKVRTPCIRRMSTCYFTEAGCRAEQARAFLLLNWGWVSTQISHL